MPKALHDKYQRQARAIYPGRSKEAKTKQNAFVYGKMRKEGWKPEVKHWGNEAS